MSAVPRAVDHRMIAVTSLGIRSLERVQWGVGPALPAGTNVGGPA